VPETPVVLVGALDWPVPTAMPRSPTPPGAVVNPAPRPRITAMTRGVVPPPPGPVLFHSSGPCAVFVKIGSAVTPKYAEKTRPSLTSS